MNKKWITENEKKEIEKEHSSTFNQYFNIYNQIKTDPTEISQKMFNSCLIIILFDYFYFFAYVLPLCIASSFHNYENGFSNMVQCVLIAYTCDAAALFAGNKFGKTKFGGPITPSKTLEGIYGGLIGR